MSDVILIENRTARILGPSYNLGQEPQVLRLMPGTNRVDRAIWSLVEGSRFIQKRVEREELAVLDDKAELAAMPLTRAIAVVGGTLDKALLSQWVKKEKRKPVLDAVAAQLDKLDGSKPDPDDEDAGPDPISTSSPLNLGGVDVSAPRETGAPRGRSRRRRG